MKLLVLIPVVLALFALRFLKPKMLTWLAAWLVASVVILKFGFATPIPDSVFKIYLGIIVGSLLIYVFSDSDRQEEVRRPLVAFLVESKYLIPLAVVALAIPAAVAANIYLDMTRPPVAPQFSRTVHPAPPDSIQVYGEAYDMITLDNPYRKLQESDPAAFAAHLENGRKIYYQNCFYCHGDLMAGEGVFSHGLNPIPTNFQDAGTIAQLQESFLFWRIAKGGPGLPAEGGPWDSAMPAWEEFLTEEEIWDVIAYLYDFTGYQPRAIHEVGGHD
ncbi:MAG: cytochrome c [Acidobacteriota bacterium]